MQNQISNLLLLSLPPESRAEMMSASRPMRLRKNRVLYEQGQPAKNAYFIESGLASAVIETAAGEQVEVAMVGNEGVVGFGALLGSSPNITRCVLQMESTAFEIRMELLCKFFEKDLNFRQRVLQFAQTYLYSTQRVAACNRVHGASERLVRWLLMAKEFSQSSQLPFTHDFLAQMVAVQRSTISAALNALSTDGLLEHGWGTVTIPDSNALAQRACSCYGVLLRLRRELYRETPDRR